MYVDKQPSTLSSMFVRRADRERRAELREMQEQVAAFDKGHAVIEFSPDGRILRANEKFLSVIGGKLDEVRGRSFSTLLVAAENEGNSYRQLWECLARGEACEATLCHIVQGGSDISLRISFTPVIDGNGKFNRVIGLAADATDSVRQDTVARQTLMGLENVSVAVMFVNRDFIVTRVNRSTQEMFSRYSDAFAKVWPGFDPAKIVGSCIDMFHRNPAHQRRMLADPSRLPFRTDISIGDLKFALNVNASYDSQGAYNGNVLEWMDVTETRMQQGQISAIDKAQAVISFSLDGRVLEANANFLKAMGYTLDEIRGQHHSTFIDQAYRQSSEYHQFWEKLGRGEYDSGQYKRIAKGGREVWLQASYNPILDINGKPFRVVKYATDITEQKIKAADADGQLAAISKAQAVIEFSLDGRVLHANANFLSVLGYTIDEVRGQHHSMFVDPVYRQSPDYRLFWDKLGRGEYDAAQYKRIAKGGAEVWIQASYNPILDLNGKPWKVVKYATDITEQVRNAELLRMAVQQVQDVVSRAQSNDLSGRVPLEGKTGDIKGLCAGVNGMLETMVGVVSGILEASSTIATAAREISMGNTDLSQRTEEQASSLEETAASLEELTATVRQNADNAQQANRLASSASEVAVKGGSVVSDVVRTMEGINEASRKIADIIGVIDEIAFQTNILALNAAVEAARAGDQGRGFAVVAAEVRNLAQRSANAAKEIKSLISESASKVESGSRLVGSAGQTMEEIVVSVKRVTDIMAEISAASKEQSSGIEQVNAAVMQMDKITQQNAALVEEAAAAAKSMEDQTDGLASMVAGFTLAEPTEALPTRKNATPAVRAASVRNSSAPAKKKPAQAASDDWKEF